MRVEVSGAIDVLAVVGAVGLRQQIVGVGHLKRLFGAIDVRKPTEIREEGLLVDSHCAEVFSEVPFVSGDDDDIREMSIADGVLLLGIVSAQQVDALLRQRPVAAVSYRGRLPRQILPWVSQTIKNCRECSRSADLVAPSDCLTCRDIHLEHSAVGDFIASWLANQSATNGLCEKSKSAVAAP